MPSPEDLAIAQTYREKSDESIEVAEACLKKGRNRSACNRAYYSVIQLLTAAGYEKLIDLGWPRPPDHDTYQTDGPNWSHMVYAQLLGNFVREFVKPLDVAALQLPQQVFEMKRYRSKADYWHPDNIPPSEAETMISRAKKIRELVYDVIGN